MRTSSDTADIGANDATGASGEPSGKGGSIIVGEFAQDMLLELRQMARAASCAYLSYLLELALIEASDLASGRKPSDVAAARSVGEAGRFDLEDILRRIITAKA